MTYLMEEMSWQEFKERKDDAVVILPVGSTEQHGPMLPLSVDTIISSSLALMLAKQVNGIVAPPINYGYKSAPLSGGGPLFPGTIDLNGMTLINLVFDVLEELIMDGVKKIFVLNGHYENEAFILEAVDLITRKYGDVIIVESNWWDQIGDKLIEKVFDEVDFPGWALEHAAIAETSLVQYFKPELVHWEKFVEDEPVDELSYRVYPAKLCSVPPTGLLSTARSSSLVKGEMMAGEIIEAFSKIIDKVMS